MKTILLSILFFLLAFAGLQAQDMPNPPANLQTLPSGSYVIPMDNTLQNKVTVGIYGKFNLKTYGLIVHLLNNNIKVKWVIRAGKLKDAADFTVPAEMVKPSFISSASRDFKSGPFVIFPSDTSGVNALIESYYTSRALTGNFRPNLFRTTTATTVDIRYDLSGSKPNGAILTDGGNDQIHRDYYIEAGITTQNYTTINALSLSSCHTFASEPHNSNSGAEIDSTVSSIRRWVLNGRNFLAQCAAVRTYENSPFGRFQTTLGISDENSNIGTDVLYPFADLSFYQFEGTYNASSGGSLKNWSLKPGSIPRNLSYNKAISTVDTTLLAITVSKMVTSGKGGLVFYMGNHDFNSSNEAGINGIRIFMSAFLTPCADGICPPNAPLPVKLTNFQCNLNNNNKVDLTWTTVSEINFNYFEVERSFDGSDYKSIAMIFAAGSSTSKTTYTYHDNVPEIAQTLIYYRLKMIDIDGAFKYSEVRVIRIDKQTDINFIAYPNPVANDVRITIPFAWQNNEVTYQIFNIQGQVMMTKTKDKASQTEVISMSHLSPGLYIVKVSNGKEISQKKLIKN